MIEAAAPAKINLTLRVVGKRPDGFHEIETLIVPILLSDRLTIEEAPEWTFACDDPTLPGDESNLVVRAARLFFAETELKAAAGSWSGSLSSLAKFALAGFYHRSGRDAQAIDLYNALIAKPNDAVPVYTAQLALADLYSASGKTEQAKQIWAKVKDADKAGAAGSIAAEKLTAKK